MENIHLVDIRLHTGENTPDSCSFLAYWFSLLGDDLYGGRLEHGIQRQGATLPFLIVLSSFLEEQLEL